MKAFRGVWKVAFLCFFISHIPITIIVDSQGVTNRYHPWAYQFLVKWYCDTFGDFLLRAGTGMDGEGDDDSNDDVSWFSSMILMGEILFQFPFFFVAIKQLNKYGNNNDNHDDNETSVDIGSSYYPEWFRMLCIIYGSHTSTTLIPILGTFLMSGDKMTTLQRCMTVAVYLPYFIFPFLLMCFAVAEDFFPEKEETTRTSTTSTTKVSTLSNNNTKEKAS